MGTTTVPLGLYKPDDLEVGWGSLVSDNFQAINDRFVSIAQGLSPVSYIITKSAGVFQAIDTSDQSVAFQGAEPGAVINAALSAAPAGGEVAIRAGMDCDGVTTSILVPAHKILSGPHSMKEGTSLGTRIRAASGLGANPLVRLQGTGPSVRGLLIDGNNQASQTVQFDSGGTEANGALVRDCLIVSGTSATVLFGTGSGRNVMFDCRLDGAGHPSNAVLEVNAPDHVMWGLRVTGVKSGARAVWLHSGAGGGMYSACHFTGNAGCLENTLIEGDENQFASVYFDTTGTTSDAILKVKGSRNQFAPIFIFNANSVNNSAIAIQKSGAGATAKGNQFLATIRGGSNNFATVLDFLSETGNNATNTDSFVGTQCLFSAGGTTAACNLALDDNDRVLVYGVITSPTEIMFGQRQLPGGVAHGIQVVKGSNQPITTGLSIPVAAQFGATGIKYDEPTSMFTDAADSVTIPFAGRWRVHFRPMFAQPTGAAVNLRAQVRKNAAAYVEDEVAARNSGADRKTVTVDFTDPCIAGDVFTFFVAHDDPTNIALLGNGSLLQSYVEVTYEGG